MRIVVNQQYPPLTEDTYRLRLLRVFVCALSLFQHCLAGFQVIYRRYLGNSSETLHIIIVPYYEMNRFSSMFLQKYLEARGHRVWGLTIFFFADNLGQIIDTTRELHLNGRQNELNEKSISIGHSMGGTFL